MGLRNPVEDLDYSETFGMDTTSPAAALSNKAGWVTDARNVNLGLEGGYDKRNGFTTQLSSAWTGKNITHGLEFKDSSGIRKTILFGTDTTGSGGAIGYVNSGAVTSLLTGLSGTTRPGFTQFRNLFFFFNGVDTPKVYDGSTVRQVGITAPVAAPTIASQTTGGSLTLLGSYVYGYSYYNSVTKAESTVSPLTSATVLTSTNTKIVLTLVAGDSTTADTIRIWRTVANGNQMFLEGTTAISSTSFNSIAADSALTTAMELDNSRITDLSSTAKYPCVAANRLFLATNSNEVRWSKIGQSGAMPESFEVKAVADTMGKSGANDQIVGLGSAGAIPIVLKQNSLGALQQIYFQDPSQPVDSAYYVYQELSDKIGAASHWAAVQVFQELIFLSKDNIYATDGQRVRPIADAIQTTIRGLGYTSSQITQISAVNDVKYRRVYFQVFVNSSASAPAYTLVGDYRQYPNFRWTWYTPGTNTSTNPGIRVASLFNVTDSSDATLQVWGGNIDLNGQIYQLNTGTNDNGAAIYAKLVSRPYAMERPLNVKLFKKAGVHLSGNGNNYNVSMYCIYDLSGSEEGLQLLNLNVGGSVYDTAVYDTGTYVDVAVAIKAYAAHRKAKFQQLVFYQTDADAPVSFYGWGSTASEFKLF